MRPIHLPAVAARGLGRVPAVSARRRLRAAADFAGAAARAEIFRKIGLARRTETFKVTVVSINHQFSIAVHIMAGLAYHPGHACVSSVLAESVNTSPAFVRRILARLSKAGLIETATGKKGACWMTREPAGVSLLEIYRAVDAPRAFAIHNYPEQPLCPISCNIKVAMEGILEKTQATMEERLASFSVADILAGIEEADEEELASCDALVPIASLKQSSAVAAARARKPKAAATATHHAAATSKQPAKVAPPRAGLRRRAAATATAGAGSSRRAV